MSEKKYIVKNNEIWIQRGGDFLTINATDAERLCFYANSHEPLRDVLESVVEMAENIPMGVGNTEWSGILEKARRVLEETK